MGLAAYEIIGNDAKWQVRTTAGGRGMRFA